MAALQIERVELTTKRFTTRFIQSDTGARLAIPFDPNDVWGQRERHYVTGSIDEQKIRACLDAHATGYVLPIGAAWVRDHQELVDGAEVEVTLAPDGHQVDTVSPDVGAALRADPEARAFFESVAPFYRNNYIRWIEEARRAETRRARIAEMVALLKAGKKQR